MDRRVGIFLLASNSETTHQIMSFIFSLFCALIRCIKSNNCTRVYGCSLLHRNHQHFHLKGNLFELGLVNSTEHDTCKQASETAFALATLRFRHLGCHFIKPGDFQDILVSKIPHFVHVVQLLNE